MARRHNNVRWNNGYKVGRPNDGGRNKERVANTGTGCFFVPIGDYRTVYNAIATLNKERGFSGPKTSREHPPIGKDVSDSQVEFDGLVKALGEEMEILRGGIHRLETARDIYKGQSYDAQGLLADIGQRYPTVQEEISQARL